MSSAFGKQLRERSDEGCLGRRVEAGGLVRECRRRSVFGGVAGRDGDFRFESGDKCICTISKWVSDRQVGKSPTYRREIKLRVYFPSQNF